MPARTKKLEETICFGKSKMLMSVVINEEPMFLEKVFGNFELI